MIHTHTHTYPYRNIHTHTHTHTYIYNSLNATHVQTAYIPDEEEEEAHTDVTPTKANVS
jgi:hypothetical protein